MNASNFAASSTKHWLLRPRASRNLIFGALVSLVLAITHFGDVLAQVPTPIVIVSPGPSSSTAPTTQGQANLNRTDHSDRHLIEMMTQFDQRLLTTVYFCLGTLLSGFALLVGYNWFANFKTYERDKKQLQQELTSNIEAQFTELREETRKAISSIESLVIKATDERVTSQIRDVTNKLDALQLRNLEAQREQWIVQGTLSNALRYATEVVEFIYDSSTTGGLHSALGSMRSIVDKILSTQTLGPDSGDMARMTQVLNKVEAKNPIVVANLKAALAKLPPRA